MPTLLEQLTSQGHEVEATNPAPYVAEWPAPVKRTELVVWCKTHKEIEFWPVKRRKR